VHVGQSRSRRKGLIELELTTVYELDFHLLISPDQILPNRETSYA